MDGGSSVVLVLVRLAMEKSSNCTTCIKPFQAYSNFMPFTLLNTLRNINRTFAPQLCFKMLLKRSSSSIMWFVSVGLTLLCAAAGEEAVELLKRYENEVAKCEISALKLGSDIADVVARIGHV